MKFNKSIFNKIFDYFFCEKEFFLKEFGTTVYKKLFINKKYFWKRVNHNYKIYSFVRNTREVYLDYGSGWGFFAFCLAGFGAEKIVGIDIREREIDIANKIKSALFPHYDIIFIHSAFLEYKNKVDVIFFNNVISHIKLPVQYLINAYDLLNYAGSISIYDSNNALSLLVQLRNRKLWSRNEKSLIKVREKIFHDYGMNESDAHRYAKLSTGLAQEDIIELMSCDNRKSIENYLLQREKVWPTQWIDPPLIDERMINPITYKRILYESGFECIRMRSTSFNFPHVSYLLDLLKFGYLISPAFHMVAEKRRLLNKTS